MNFVPSKIQISKTYGLGCAYSQKVSESVTQWLGIYWWKFSLYYGIGILAARVELVPFCLKCVSFWAGQGNWVPSITSIFNWILIMWLKSRSKVITKTGSRNIWCQVNWQEPTLALMVSARWLTRHNTALRHTAVGCSDK